MNKKERIHIAQYAAVTRPLSEEVEMARKDISAKSRGIYSVSTTVKGSQSSGFRI